MQYHPVPTILTLTADDVTVTVHPDAGCRIGQISVAGQPLLVDVPDVSHAMTWGSFPMAPWAGRIAHGRFTFDGIEHQLDINHHDGDGPRRAHAIHGLVFDRPWVHDDLHDVSDTSCTASCGFDWGFGGQVTQTIELHADRVTTTLTIESTGRAFPAELGWHPWFRKPDRSGVLTDRDVRTRRVRHPRRARSSSPARVRGTTASSTPRR